MSALVAAVFVASLAGSLHCAGMCGPFAAIAVGSSRAGFGAAVQAAYNGGRLVSYVVLGALAGALGAALDLGGAWFGVQRAALVVAGAGMIVFGVVALLATTRFGPRLPAAPRALQRLYAGLHRRSVALTAVPRALVVGLGSTLLPCGWLYAFVVTAAGTGSAAAGALTMAVFWSGTLPVMLAVGAGIRRLAGPLAARVPALAALALILVGVVAVAGRLGVVPPDPAAPGESVSCPLHP